MGRLLTRLSLLLLSLGALIGAAFIFSPAAKAMPVGDPAAPHAIRFIPAVPTTYTVKSGDNLSTIAQHLDRTWQQFAGYNHMTWTQAQAIMVGQVLRIPTASYRPPLYVAPAPPAYMPPTPSKGATTPVSATSFTSGGWSGPWACIAQGESGSNPADNTGNGFYGGLQFAMSTWQSNGGTGNPADASIAEQEAVAESVLASQGWGAWPNTSRACGY